MKPIREKVLLDKNLSINPHHPGEGISIEQPAEDYFPSLNVPRDQNNVQVPSARILGRGHTFNAKSVNSTPRALEKPNILNFYLESPILIAKCVQKTNNFKSQTPRNENQHFFPPINRQAQTKSTSNTPRNMKEMKFSFKESPKQAHIFRVQPSNFHEAAQLFSSKSRNGSDQTMDLHSELNSQLTPRHVDIIHSNHNLVKSPRKRFLTTFKRPAEPDGPYLLRGNEEINFKGKILVEAHEYSHEKIGGKSPKLSERNDQIEARNFGKHVPLAGDQQSIELDYQDKKITQVLKSEAMNLTDREAYKRQIFANNSNIAILKKLLHP